MAIEFRCTQCSQLLRVPDDSAGKNARCPKCQALMLVPGASSATVDAPPVLSSTAPPASTDEPPVFAGAGSGGFAPPPPAKPTFTDAGGGSPFGRLAPQSANPYASPTGAAIQPSMFPVSSVPINPRPVPVEAILNYAWPIWQANLGLLLAVMVTIIAANWALSFPFMMLQMVLQQRGEQEAAFATQVLSQIVINVFQGYLTIGQTHIALKLARRQPALYSDLFGGLPLLLPVIGGSLIAFICLFFGAILLIVPAILMSLAFWPFYYLIVDRKAGVIESFSMASQITKGNWGNAFLLWLLSIGIVLLGCMAFCIGILFAQPLVILMWAVAYLMMSGQLEPQPVYSKSYVPA